MLIICLSKLLDNADDNLLVLSSLPFSYNFGYTLYILYFCGVSFHWHMQMQFLNKENKIVSFKK
jgi:hypothetical protein